MCACRFCNVQDNLKFHHAASHDCRYPSTERIHLVMDAHRSFTIHHRCFANTEHCRYSNEKNPQVFHKQPYHSNKPTVWCHWSHGGLLGAHFVWNDEKINAIVNGNRYTLMLYEIPWTELETMDIGNTWFQPCATQLMLDSICSERNLATEPSEGRNLWLDRGGHFIEHPTILFFLRVTSKSGSVLTIYKL